MGQQITWAQYETARDAWARACASGDELEIAVCAIMVARLAKQAQGAFVGAVHVGSVR